MSKAKAKAALAADKPKVQRTKKFFVTLTAEVNISTDILKTSRSKAWAKQFYTFNSDEEVAMYLARLFMLGYRAVREIDGYADKSGDDPSRLVEIRPEEATRDRQ